jgi:hypothetical protein
VLQESRASEALRTSAIGEHGFNLTSQALIINTTVPWCKDNFQ